MKYLLLLLVNVGAFFQPVCLSADWFATIESYDVDSCPSLVSLETSSALCVYDGHTLPNPSRGEVKHLVSLTDTDCNYAPFENVLEGVYAVLYFDAQDELKVVTLCVLPHVSNDQNLYITIKRQVGIFSDGFETGDTSNWSLTHNTN